MEKSPKLKRKAAVCTEHHKACKCREEAFNKLLLACQESLNLSEYCNPHFNNANEPWEAVREEREISAITDQIRKAIKVALQSNELVNEEITDIKQR